MSVKNCLNLTIPNHYHTCRDMHTSPYATCRVSQVARKMMHSKDSQLSEQDNGLRSPGSDRLPKKTQMIERAPLKKKHTQIHRWKDPRIEGYKNSKQRSQVPIPKDAIQTPKIYRARTPKPICDNAVSAVALDKLGKAQMRRYLKVRSLDIVEKAIAIFRSGLSLSNISEAYKAQFYLNLGKAYLTRNAIGDSDLAIHAFTEGLKLEQRNPSKLQQYLGKAYLRRKLIGDLDLAISAFTEGLKVEQQHPSKLQQYLKDANAKKDKSV